MKERFHYGADECGAADDIRVPFIVAPETIERFRDDWERASLEHCPILQYVPGDVMPMRLTGMIPLWSEPEGVQQ